MLAALHDGARPVGEFDDRIVATLVADGLVEVHEQRPSRSRRDLGAHTLLTADHVATQPAPATGSGGARHRDYGGLRQALAAAPSVGTCSGGIERRRAIDVEQLEAVIFDTDGVITQTAAVHFSAWKDVFDEFLAAHATGAAAAEFTDADYRVHVDGIGRYDGVDAFLRSRGFELPRGDPDDAPGDDTVCAVGNKKNASFAAAIEQHGVRPYTTTRRFIEALHAHGIRTAVISASKNCEMVLRAAGMLDLFEVRVDGNDAAEMGFPGKPAPDVFLEAAKRLGVDAAAAAVVEDAISGVRAGRAGGFGLVVGLDRTRNPEPLAEFADIVVPDLSDLEVVALDADDAGGGAGVRRVVPARAWLPDLSDALTDYDLTRQIADKTVAVFCDYDGALTPIVDRPEDAHIPPATLEALEALADLTVVGVVSGRDLVDVMGMVPTERVWFAGSHGFDVRRPDGTREEFPEGAAALPALDSAERCSPNGSAPSTGRGPNGSGSRSLCTIGQRRTIRSPISRRSSPTLRRSTRACG